MAKIELKKIKKHYGNFLAIPDLDLEINDKEFVVLVGPSGCGKSTALRLIAGLENITGGELLFNDVVVNQQSPVQRNVAMVFQNYALYPHMNVRRNLSFGLENLKIQQSEIDERVMEVANALGLEELLDRKPAQLSGGQRQRVAMGRAIVRKPEVFLFDEPLSNLDAKLRTEMRVVIKKLHRQVDTTVVYVTHDQVEAMTLADRIVVMRAGKIEQQGTPEELFNRPNSLFVAGFLGSPQANLIKGAVTDGRFQSENGKFAIDLPTRFKSLGNREIVLCIRPDDIVPTTEAPNVWKSRLSGNIEVVEPLGTESYLVVDAGVIVTANLPNRTVPNVGDHIEFAVNDAALLAFDAETEQRIDLENL